MIIWLYRYVLYLLAPLMPLYLDWRLRHNKEDPARLKERYGYASIVRETGPYLWIHAASVGESQSSLILIERIQKLYPHFKIIVTTGTKTSAEMMAKKLPKGAVHQYVPLDHEPWVRRFLAYWRPSLAILVESEIWPNMILVAKKMQVPMVLVNGRLSVRSFKRWGFALDSARCLFGSFQLCLAQDDKQKFYLIQLGARHVLTTGNLKWAAEPLPFNENDLKSLKNQIGDRPFWLAASTHPGEENIIIETHQCLKKDFPDLLTIIAIRHPHRGEEVANLLKGTKFQRRSESKDLSKNTEVYLVDQMGEMGLFYALSDIVFVAGSFYTPQKNKKVKGHNPIEPAQYSCAILHGPDMANNKNIIDDLHAAHSVVEVADGLALQEALSGLLADPAKVVALGKKAHKVAQNKRQVIDQIITNIQPVLDDIHV